MFGHGPSDVTRIEVEPEVVGFLVALVRALCPRYVVETGTYHGTTARAIGEALVIGQLDTIERDEYSAGLAREATAGLPVKVCHCESLAYAPWGPIDLLFLDSDIGDTRLLELAHFAPHLAPQGTVAIHDTRDLWSERPAFDGWRWVELGTPRGLTLLQR